LRALLLAALLALAMMFAFSAMLRVVADWCSDSDERRMSLS